MRDVGTPSPTRFEKICYFVKLKFIPLKHAREGEKCFFYIGIN